MTDVEKNWGWLAHLIAGIITTFFTILKAYLNFIYSTLRIGPKGLYMLTILHLLPVLYLLSKGL